MAVDVEVRGISVHALAYPVREPAYGQDVPGRVEGQRVGLGQAFSRKNFVFDRMETGVVGLEWMGSHRL